MAHASPLDLLPSSLNKSLTPNVIYEAIQQGQWRSSHLEKLWKDFDSDKKGSSQLPSLRFGFVQPMASVTYKETLDLTLTLKCLGNERWMRLISPKYRHVPNLLAALDAAKSLELEHQPHARDSQRNALLHYYTNFSPLFGDLAGLPPTQIGICGLDPLRDEGLLYERLLRENGVTTRLHVYPGVPHGFPSMFPLAKVGRKWEADWHDGIKWLLQFGRAK
ncbi:hypothetical protein R3P38DRAFT_3256610 [Favolaschia claudopus]|uniref:Alpha/beta hydrolase fold-3 domain-containing protein n=1 Tax=Favolaschia claudopus TaxID=2862362 RepID=A0AAW0DGZ3_9AGAR